MADDDYNAPSYKSVQDLEGGDFALMVQFPYEPNPEVTTKVPTVWTSFKKLLEIAGVTRSSNQSYIPTTVEDLQAKIGDQFRIAESGRVLLPEDAGEGDIVPVIDLARKLATQSNEFVAPIGQTIGKYQIKDPSKVSRIVDLQNNEGFERFYFIYYESEKDWGLLMDGVHRTINTPYIYTTQEDLSILPYSMIGIKQPGNILLWEPTEDEIGEYATITDGGGLLVSQSNILIAPPGHLLGKGFVPDEKLKDRIDLSNPNGANWFRPAYLGNKLWELTVVTQNG